MRVLGRPGESLAGGRQVRAEHAVAEDGLVLGRERRLPRRVERAHLSTTPRPLAVRSPP